MAAGGHEDKRDVMQAPHQMGNEWGMYHPTANDGYMNNMYSNYDQPHQEMKKEYGGHEGGQTGYYVSSANLGADGTLDPPF